MATMTKPQKNTNESKNSNHKNKTYSVKLTKEQTERLMILCGEEMKNVNLTFARQIQELQSQINTLYQEKVKRMAELSEIIETLNSAISDKNAEKNNTEPTQTVVKHKASGK